MKLTDLSSKCLCFPEKYFENKNITNEEEETARLFVSEILDKTEQKHIFKASYLNQLIKTIVLANRIPKCKAALGYILTNFKKLLIPSYFPAYNLVFMGATVFDGVVGSSNPLDIISRLLYKKKIDNLDETDKIECVNFAVCVREIFAVSQLLKSDLHFGGPQYITHLYNLLDKFNYIFKRMFNFRVFDVYRKLTPHRYARHAIAHSHYVFDKIDENNMGRFKLVYWERQGNRKLVAKGDLEEIIGITIEEIRRDMLYLCVIICQLLVYFQILFQIK